MSIEKQERKTSEIIKATNEVITNLEQILTKNQIGVSPDEARAWDYMTKEEKQVYLRKNYPQDYR